MATMKAAQVTRPGGPIELVEREVPQPGSGRSPSSRAGLWHLPQRRVDEGRYWPGIQYPRVPGHEIAGVVDEVGVGLPAGGRVSEWAWAGMAATAAIAAPADAGISSTASTFRFRESLTTAATRSTWWPLRMPWRSCRTVFPRKKPLRCFARASPLQRATAQRRAARRPGGDTRGGRVGPLGNSVREQVWI